MLVITVALSFSRCENHPLRNTRMWVCVIYSLIFSLWLLTHSLIALRFTFIALVIIIRQNNKAWFLCFSLFFVDFLALSFFLSHRIFDLFLFVICQNVPNTHSPYDQHICIQYKNNIRHCAQQHRLVFDLTWMATNTIICFRNRFTQKKKWMIDSLEITSSIMQFQ